MSSNPRGVGRSARGRTRQRPCRQLVLERLEGRFLPSTTFTQTNLVSDVPGMARTTDANLVNPWGRALGTNSGLWVAENGTGMPESFDGSGRAVQGASTIPDPGGTPRAPRPAVSTHPTG